MIIKIKKVFRFFQLYGFKRTIIKIAGRTRRKQLSILLKKRKKDKNISLIGCGQFGFSTISFFLNEQVGNRFLQCYDIDDFAARTTSEFWGYEKVENPETIFLNPKCKYVYIASNHYTHTEYAIEALRAGKTVYCEKPISVSIEQLKNLVSAIKNNNGKICFGYNRPFSKAIDNLYEHIKERKLPITLSCFVSAHKLEEEHWYNNPCEGTRICGNLGHWIDLSLYLFSLRGKLPKQYNISLTYADRNVIDDNITVSFSTEFGDLVTLTLSSRTEPFEGINETIDFQCGDVISKIDDFRKQTIWVNDKVKKYKFYPKDVGHKKAILQPFGEEQRDISIVIASTRLMLEIRDMALEHKTHNIFEMNGIFNDCVTK